MKVNCILQGNALDVLKTLPDASFQTIITSPPFYGLRDYQVPPTVWDGCGAWYGCLGLEPTPQLYVQHLVQVFHEARRVLRRDGTLWLNLGDSFWGSGSRRQGDDNDPPWRREWLKQKDLIGIPWRCAFALQADGWYLRADCVWRAIREFTWNNPII